MEKMSRITPWKTPKIWLLNRYYTGAGRPGFYLAAILPSVIIAIGLIADLTALYDLEDSVVWIFTLSLMFIYGLINIIFIWALQKSEVRLERSRKTYNILHEKVITTIKDYRSKKDLLRQQGKEQKEDLIVQMLGKLLSGINDTYIKEVHKKNVAITLKYEKSGKLYHIREGGNSEQRKEQGPEEVENSHVYRCLNHIGQKLRFIYVKNIEKPDKYELAAIGPLKDKIIGRASNNYKTFIALPIRGGRIYADGKNGFTSAPNLGMIGIDLKEKYGFGNFTEHEYDYLASFASILSEPVQDLIEIKN